MNMEIPTNWTFKNQSVAQNFDAHVREQQPWYELATGIMAHCVRHYLPQNGIMYDLGCSTGNVEIALDETLTKRNIEYIPIDNSEEMLDQYKGCRDVKIADIESYAYKNHDVCVSFLVLMFLSLDEREALLETLLSKLNEGGCLIVFDKTEIASGYLSTVLHRATLAGKVASGVSAEEIIAKELSLAGVQRPFAQNYFTKRFPNCVEIFRFGEFAGWLIEK